MKKNKNFLYGIGAVLKEGVTVGYIEKNSWDMGGAKPEATDVEAEQVPGSPVLVIPQSNGTIAPTFNMIQLNYEGLAQMLGGRLHRKEMPVLDADGAPEIDEETGEVKTEEQTVGWTAPRAAVVLEGPWEIRLVSGQSVLIPQATLLSNLGGKLTLTETAKIECQLKVTAPETAGMPPYGVFDSDALPDEWMDYGLPITEE